MDDELFKVIEASSLTSLRIDDLQIEEEKYDDIPEIPDSDIDHFQSAVNSIVEASNQFDKVSVAEYAKELLEGLEYYTKIPDFSFMIDNKIIEICVDYFKRYSDGNDEAGINCLGVLSYLSHQSSAYTTEFKPILHILFKKIENKSNIPKKMQIQVIDILSNCMLDNNLVRVFDDFSIKDFNKNYVENISSTEEAESVSRFYEIYLEEKAPEDILFDIFHHMVYILRQTMNDRLTINCANIFTRLSDLNAIDFPFFYENKFNEFLFAQRDKEILTPLVIYFCSRCFYFSEQFREYNIFTPEELISYLINDEEHNDMWFKRASAATNFLSTMAQCHYLSDDYMLSCAKWICDGEFEAPVLLKKTMHYLMQSILMNAGVTFMKNADLESVFSFLEETISIKDSKTHLAIACEAMLTFADNAEKLSINIRSQVIQSDYLNTLLSLIDDCDKACEIFDSFRKVFCS